jgi:hypothetical protein
MQPARTFATVHNRHLDKATSVIVDIVAPRRLSNEEMEVHVARALQKLKNDAWPKPGEVLTVLAMNVDESPRELAEHESRWLR